MFANPTNLAATVRRRLLVPAAFCLAALFAPAAFAQNAINTATISPPAGVTDPVGGCTGTPPVCSGNNTATDSDTIVAPQLTLAKVANPSPFTVGVAGNYTLTLTNTGTAATTAVSTIVDTIATGLTIGTLPAGCSAAGQVVTCTVAAGQATGAGAAVSFVIPVTPQASVGGTTVANTARASGGGDATCPATGATQARCNPTINTPVSSAANVAVVKTGPATVVAGASYTYILALTNSGQTATGTNVVVQDQLPAGAIATAATGATCTNLNTAGALLTCTVPGPIAAGATVNVQLTVTAPATAGAIANYAATNPTGTGNPGTPPGAGCTSNATVSCSSATTTVQAPQLTMAKTHTGNFTVGSNGQYTLTVSNTGTAPTTGTITITDTLPTGLTFVSATGAGWTCGAAAQVVTCTRTTAVAAGAAAPAITLTVAVGGTAAATVTNTARASGGGDTTCPAPPAAALARCSASDPTTVLNSSDLSLTKTVDIASPVVGSNVTFTVTVTNGGPSGATGVQVVDQLPAGYTFVSSTPSAGTYTAATGVWAIGPIANGTSVTLQIVATVNAAGPYTNTAQVTAADQPDPDSTPGDGTGDDFGSITPTPVASANLSITKSQATPNPAVPGQAVTWTITVNNTGPSAAAAVTTADAVPSTVTGLTVGGTDGGSCTVTGQNVNCAFGTVANGATRAYTITGTLAATATGSLANTVSVSSTTADPTPGNNTSTSTTPVQPSADISVAKTLTTAGPYTVGQAVSFDIVVSNAGPSVATNVALTDTPTNLGALIVTGACTAFPCTIASIASGASATVTVTGTIQADGAFANSATATLPAGTTDPNPGNNTGSDGDNTTPTADISVVKTLTTAGPYTIGQAVSFDIVVSNAGPSIATSVALTDTPTNLGALTVTGACTAFPCTIASIASGASATVTVTGTIQSDGAFANSATATLPAGTTDPNPGNNTGSDGDNTTPTADISVVKTLTTAGPYTIGQAVSFDIVVSNAGASVATNIALTDTPTNLGALTVTGACTAFPCTIASIASGASATVTVTGTIQSDGAFANSATATLPAGTTDPNPGNNTGSDGDNTTPTADIALSKTLTTTGTIIAGQAVSYEIVVTNNGPSTATGIVVTDTPTNLAITGVSGGGCGGFPCTIATLASGGAVTITVTGTVGPTGGVFNNSASADAAQADPVPGNNSDDAPATAGAQPIVAQDDTNPTPVNGTTGGPAIANVLNANGSGPDTLNGVQATLATVTITVASPVPPQLAFDPATGAVSVNPGSAAGSYTFDYQICEQLNPSNCDTASVTVTVGAAVIDAVDDDYTGTPVNGASGGTTASVLVNDTLNGAPVTVGVGGTVTLTPGASPTPGLAMNADGTITVAAGTPAGTYAYPYTICEVLNPSNCDTAIATVLVNAAVIDAVDDTGTVANGTAGGVAVPNVLVNDTLNGAPATLATVTISQASTTNPNVTIDPATGSVNVAPNTPAGTYTLVYQICEQLNPSNCDTASVTVTVGAAVIDAVDDDYTGTPVNGASGGTTASVLVNDTLNGAPVTVGVGGNVTLTPGASPNPGLTMNADGTITVAAGTAAGTYQYPYTICEVLNPSNCDTAIATVLVNAAVIDAVDDTGTVANGTTGGVAVANVLVNDTLNGAPATLATVTISQVSTTNPNVTIDPATGAVNVAPGTPAGTVTLVYQICEQLNPSNCDTASVTVTVGAAVIDAVDDDYTGTPVNGASGGTTASVLVNDTLNGAPVTVGVGGNVTLTPGASPNPGLAMNADGTITVAAGTAAGTYAYPYTICEVLNPSNCDTAIATVVVNAATIDAVDDSAQTPQNVPVTIAVLGNDTLNGAPVDPTEVTVTQVAPPANGTITINADGTITYTPNPNFSGTDTFSYQICENLNPTNCATATVTVTVPANTVTAIDDTETTPQNTPVTTSVLGNDSSSGAPLDPDSVAVTVPPGNGTVVVNPDGTITYTPNPGFSGADTFTYQVCDTSAPTPVCDTAVVTITVQPNTVTAVDDSGTTPQGTPVTTPVLGNDTSTGAPLDPGSVEITVPPGNGTVVVNPDGTITYTPNPGFSGTDTYTYQVCDTSTPTPVCDTAVVTITVQPNTVTAVDDTGTTPADTPVTIPVLGNDTSSGAPLDPGSVEITQPPGNGTVVVNPDGTITYTPNPGFIGTDTFTYQVCDTSTPTPVCTTATVTVTVTGQPPVANPDADEGTGDIGQPVTIPVLDNDSDPDNNIDPGTVVVVGAPGDGRRLEVPGEGTWTVNPDGTITFTPEPGFVGSATPIQYTVSDTTGLVSNPATVNVTIVGDASLRVVKTATPRDVKVGDLVRYTVTIENVGAANVVDATLVDTPPAGFSYVDGTLSVADGDGAARLVGTYPIRVDQIDIAIDERATVVYLLRVGAGVRGGIHRNSALVQDNGATVSNTATADVQLVADPMMDESLILGTVFDDRDGDGWQDPAAMGGVRVQGGFAPDAYVAGSSTLDRGDGPQPLADASAPLLRGIDLGDIAGRQSDADSVDARRVVVSQVLTAPRFADDFMLTTRQGVTLRMDAAGNTRLERAGGDAAKGLTGAEPTVERRVSQVANGYRVDYVIGNAGVDERGIPGVRIASVEGLLVETDQFGRYHLVGIDGGSWERGRNFILKVDPATVPPGSTFTTDNPLLRRVTPGLPVRFDFGIRLPPGLVEGGTQDVEMTLGEVMFDAESAKLRTEYLPVIEKIAGAVREHRGGEVVLAAGAAGQGADSQALAYERGKAVQSALLAALSPEDAANVRISLRVDPEDPATTALSLGATPVLGTVLFDTDRAEVRPAFAALVEAIAADIGKRGGGTDVPIVIGIVGHADKRGSDAYNVTLGLRRAKAVFEAIAAKLDPEGRARLRVDISEDPTAPLQTDAARGE